MDERDFKSKLTPEQYRVMRERGTETAFAGKFWDHDDHGLYLCAACDQVLFSSLQKFDANTGWPTFHGPFRKKHIELHNDEQGQEIRCARCQSHLGYVIDGNYRTNSVALHFIALEGMDLEGEEAEAKEKETEKPGSSSTMKNFTLTIGGLAIGIAVGAAAAPAPAQPVCTPTPLVQAATPSFTPSPTPRPTPPATIVPSPTATAAPAGGTRP
jgi:peptide-methionine (R)-S-oxide reductase